MAGRTCQGGTTCMHCRLVLARMSRESALPTVTSPRLWYVRGRRLCRGAKSGRCESPQAWNDTNVGSYSRRGYVLPGHRPQVCFWFHAGMPSHIRAAWVRSRCSIMWRIPLGGDLVVLTNHTTTASHRAVARSSFIRSGRGYPGSDHTHHTLSPCSLCPWGPDCRWGGSNISPHVPARLGCCSTPFITAKRRRRVCKPSACD
jgi:hypothetical protein